MMQARPPFSARLVYGRKDLTNVMLDERDPEEFLYTPPASTLMNIDMAEVKQIAEAIIPSVFAQAHVVIMEQRNNGEMGKGLPSSCPTS